MEGAPPQIERKLGLPMCVALVVGNMIGAGVFLLPASLAPLGWNSVLGWVMTIAGSLCLAAVFARLACGRANSCAAFTYPAAAFGPGVGFIVAWSYWISCWTANATLAIAVVSNLSIIWPALAQPLVPAAASVAILWLVTLINCRGVRTAGGVQLITTILKLVPLAGAILVGFWLLPDSGEALARHNEVPISWLGISSAATLTLFAMLGFESAAVAGDRVENPERNVPRATLIGTLIAGIIYLLACSAVTLLLPVESVSMSNAPFATFFSLFVDPTLGSIVAAFVAISALGALNGFVLLQAEMPLALTREGLLPRWLGTLNQRAIPYRVHFISSGLATFVILANYSRGLADLFQFMVLVTTSSSIFLYAGGALAELQLARKGELRSSPFALIVAAAGGAYAIWALYGAGIEASAWTFAMTAAGLPIYLIMRAANRSSPMPAANPAVSPESAA